MKGSLMNVFVRVRGVVKEDLSGGASMLRVHLSVGGSRKHRALLGGRWLSLLLGLVLALASCGPQFTCRGCIENVKPGHVDYRYLYFNGPFIRNVNAKAGQTLTVDYTANVEEGSLDIRVVNPGGDVVWQKTFDTGANATSSQQVSIQQNGRYQIVVDGHQTRGSFHIDWQVN
jgi:hypothetical protein